MFQNLGGRLTAILAIAAAAYTTEQTSAAIDLVDYDGEIKFLVNAPNRASGDSLVVKLTECDTTGGSYTDVASGTIATVTDANGGILSANFDTNKLKRFVKVVATPNDTTSGVYSVEAVAEKARGSGVTY